MYAAFRRAARAAGPVICAGAGLAACATLPPAAAASGDFNNHATEIAEVPPLDKLRLVQAQLVFRHGARTPVHAHALVPTSPHGWSTPPTLDSCAPRLQIRHVAVS